MSLALQCGALLLAFNLLAGQIGCLSTALRDYTALVLCLPVLIVQIRPGFPAASWTRRGLALALLILILGSFCAGGVHAVFGVFLGLLLPFIVGVEKREPNPGQPMLLLMSAGVGLWLIAQQTFPVVFLWLDKISRLVCGFSSLLARPAIELGPSYSGLVIMLLFLITHVAIFAVSRPRELRRLLALAGGQLVLLVPYQLLFHRWLLHWRLESPWVLLGTAQLGLFLAGFLLVALHLRLARTNLQPLRWWVPAGRVVALGAASLLLFVSSSDGTWAVFQSQVRPKVLLYDDGTLDWSVPEYGKYSGRAGGMFGSLGPFLQRHNCQAARAPLTEKALAEANVLVVFNLGHKFSAEEKRRIWAFVTAGGGLLVVGDHTGTTAIREPFNDLLAPLNIRFNFDCAMPRRMLWAEGPQSIPHYTTCGLESAAGTQISVGASLSIGWPARPVLIGPHGFSDKGDLKNAAMGYLGNRQYSNDERLGDVVLVATADYKKGKVLVFGDTTSFQNGALALSGDFVRAIFHWLAMPELRKPKVLSWLFLGALVALFWWRIGAEASWPVAWLSLFACSYLGYATSLQIGRHCCRPPAAAPGAKEALIDASHLSRCDQELWQPDGLGGLAQNLMRKHYLPVVTHRFWPQLLGQSRLVFLLAPAKPFRPSELAAYEAFVREGGSLYISVGYEEAGACQELLRHFGFQLRNLPLGPISPETNSVPIFFLNAWPIKADLATTEVLCRKGQHPLIACRGCGRGKVFLIGDSGFFLNRNLEMAESYNLQNIEFLRKLIPDHE